ncbi:MAG: DNA alkylation repair protein [Oscillospiraceae bacterium]|nr:DNA alkylation repair protein [Oscillospiraceae bacterium]
MPTVPPERVIGVRTPALRALARELRGTPDEEAFLRSLPHAYYEEDNLHGILLSGLSGYEETVAALEEFLPYVDNWATCDLLRPRAFARRPAGLTDRLLGWMESGHPYTVRFGMEMLMCHYLEEGFSPEWPARVAAVQSEHYYVRMMQAWYFATALAKQYEAVLPFLEQRRLEPWTHNKAIQKAIESLRITPEHKAYLRTLRRR